MALNALIMPQILYTNIHRIPGKYDGNVAWKMLETLRCVLKALGIPKAKGH